MNDTKKKVKILIVDDDQSFQDLTGLLLSGRGYEIDKCLDARTAIEKFLADGYTHIVVDLNMPGMSGEQLLESLRDHKTVAKLAVVTGYSPFAVPTLSVMRKGFKVIFHKPVQPEVILSWIET
jgi:FixJ family two-component response regulator